MKIDSKFQLPQFSLNLSVIEAFDFREEPILLLEQDEIGNLYLSYLSTSNTDSEIRSYVQVSKERLNEVLENRKNIYDTFISAENNVVYIIEYSLYDGKILQSYLVPSVDTHTYNLIPQSYNFTFEYSIKEAELNENYLLGYSERTNKLILDFYLQSQNLISSIKPYAIFKVLTPLVDIIKNLLEFDNRNADKHISFNNLRHSSLGITIEINYSKDLFLEKETEAIEKIMQLLNAQNKDEFKRVINSTKNNRYIKEYSTIIKAIIENDATLNTAYANPINKEVQIAVIDKEKAKIAKAIIDESLDVVEDVEIIEGIFREIDIDSKEPSFKIYSEKEDFSIRGKFELSILEKIKNDYLNIGREYYKFTIKTIYHPETSVKSEEIKRFLTDYELIKQ
ncbi:DUF6575 domain-containing protein [Pedobacter sp. UBA4863]|uniref:DUF6575 domain-containing protein n=1 Tax=Pedobacter sp. UBA4863 TaxID=1947060 RepID=UPI0025E785D6|nr:DUF6575 domain-containing protein [Pedobacter sp. UBA4863]